ncbi:MAG: hypothetical protein NTU47_05730 [Ignavibacteriales bacterium]|nr:hypothetical protein [Ignavibacteriales bacterium]
MGWSEEEQKQKMAETAERGKVSQTRNKKVLRIAGIVTVLALIVFAVDLVTREKGARLPLDLRDQEGTVAAWKHDGFVKSIDNASATVVVDEAVWKEISHDEKTTIIAFLGSYCAEKSGAAQAVISIRGDNSHALLGGIDSVGMKIN